MKTLNIKVELTDEEYEMLQRVYKEICINDRNVEKEESQLLEHLYYKGLLWINGNDDFGNLYETNFDKPQIELLN